MSDVVSRPTFPLVFLICVYMWWPSTDTNAAIDFSQWKAVSKQLSYYAMYTANILTNYSWLATHLCCVVGLFWHTGECVVNIVCCVALLQGYQHVPHAHPQRVDSEGRANQIPRWNLDDLFRGTQWGGSRVEWLLEKANLSFKSFKINVKDNDLTFYHKKISKINLVC